jgi:hypothetical protein
MKFAETNRLCRKKFKRLTGMSRRTFYGSSVIVMQIINLK